MRVIADLSPVSRFLFLPALLVVFSGQVFMFSIASAEAPPEGQSFLTSTFWSASAYSEHAGGAACWLIGDDGSLRVEVLREPEDVAELPRPTDADLEPLLTWTGNGWTLVLGPDGNGTLNAWGREWQQVPVGLAQVVRVVTASLQSFPGRPPEFPFAFFVGDSQGTGIIPRPKMLGSEPTSTGDPDVWRYQLAPLVLQETEDEDVPGFRRKMTTRGRGAGGVGEILVLKWIRPEGQEGFGLRIGSSRRPGTLNLDPPRNLAVAAPEPEVFLPLWPLAHFFKTR